MMHIVKYLVKYLNISQYDISKWKNTIFFVFYMYFTFYIYLQNMTFNVFLSLFQTFNRFIHSLIHLILLLKKQTKTLLQQTSRAPALNTITLQYMLLSKCTV